MSQYTGGCACGSIRYELSAEPKASFHCHCRQCQQLSGTGHSSLFMVPTAEVALSGELKFYDTTADSGNTVSHGFCPHCGSPIMNQSASYPDMRLFHAANLDDPSLFKPQKAIWSSARPAWDYIDPDLPVF